MIEESISDLEIHGQVVEEFGSSTTSRTRRKRVPATLAAKMIAPAKIANPERKRITSATWSTTCCTMASASATLITVTVGNARYAARSSAPTSAGFMRTPP